jgi:hypothetical protein
LPCFAAAFSTASQSARSTRLNNVGLTSALSNSALTLSIAARDPVTVDPGHHQKSCTLAPVTREVPTRERAIDEHGVVVGHLDVAVLKRLPITSSRPSSVAGSQPGSAA